MQTSSGLSFSFVLLCQSVLYKKIQKNILHYVSYTVQGKIILKSSLTRNVRDMELLIYIQCNEFGFFPPATVKTLDHIVQY